MVKRGRVVEVVEFTEPCPVGKKRKDDDVKRRRKPKAKDAEEIEYQDRLERERVRKNKDKAWDDVLELGASNLGKRERKLYEQDRLAKLGIAKPRNEKTPLKVLFSKLKTHAKRDAKRLAEEKASGVVVAKKKEEKKKGKAKRRYDDIHYWEQGRQRGGVLKLWDTK
mmetsp:Transcript_19270/g.31670  ORF Transcript_19270/g.31670 Transcript_19270/m.31670 type:complete len:167 (+) Transcript_19270:155-655(+)|eukprot:CAMPEP_0203774598 /NCGR_PEP_ID=MMETSP0099_2-20121227/5455_1 /ASSEMBLY_ACC=CAM_ASM_000209 /TAXON_ID=96639 /ORGANISM=" , Strain NY0313808BC1" /LENGTH=166 /DNA_ID=CAMNT_0050672863 /DNA_START=244 /DNA_END=744 /DNA_ORIENTATION=-